MSLEQAFCELIPASMHSKVMRQIMTKIDEFEELHNSNDNKIERAV